MGRQLLLTGIFTAFVLLLPLLALVGGPAQMQSQLAENASSQPAQPAAQSQPGDQAPVVAEPESYTLYDRGSGETFTVDARQLARGMLAAEMPPTFHPEALKAQAVAGHTYVSYLRRLREAAGQEGPDLECDAANWQSYTTQEAFYQRYGELADAYWQAICQAADQVSAYLLTYQTFTPQELSQAVAAAWPQLTLEGDPSGWLEVAARSPSGYVTQVRLGEGLTVHGKELRAALGLRSADFDLGWDGQVFTFTVRGYGHGVGFSQYGADYMARQGATFDEILAHYYPGSTLAMAAA